MRQQYLLIEDVEEVGRRGEVIFARAGFARNYLLPRGKAVLMTSGMVRMQQRLQEERAKQAAIEKKEAEQLAQQLSDVVLSIWVKVDPEGHMYGSVGVTDIIALFAQEGISLHRRNIYLPKPVKEVGEHLLLLHLQEGVVCNYTLQVMSETLKTSRGG